MNHTTFIAAALAAFALAACTKSASVQAASNGKLTLEKPAAVVLHRGGMTKTLVKIQRQGVLGDVTVRFANLPKGVDVVESDSKIVGDEGSYTLRASDEADLVENSSAQVSATGGASGMAVTQPFDVSVKAKQ